MATAGRFVKQVFGTPEGAKGALKRRRKTKETCGELMGYWEKASYDDVRVVLSCWQNVRDPFTRSWEGASGDGFLTNKLHIAKK